MCNQNLKKPTIFLKDSNIIYDECTYPDALIEFQS